MITPLPFLEDRGQSTRGALARSPRVTAVVPAYNSARYLPAALDSILGQTYGDLEVLVMDDGSTDDTRGTLKPYEHRIQYYYQENRGIGETRNRALQLAKGEYIAFLDSDDVWEPDHLRIKVAALDRFPDLGGVFGEFRIIDSNGIVVSSAGIAMQFKVFERHGIRIEEAFQGRTDLVVDGRAIPLLFGHIFDTMFLGNFILPTSLVMRRQAALANGAFPGRRTQEDYDYLLRFARHQHFGFVPEPLVRYRRHADQLTSFDRIESILVAASQIISGYEAEFARTGRTAMFDARKAGLCSALGATYLRQGRKQAARAAVAEAIRRAPTDWRAYAQYALSFVPHRLLATMRGW